MDGWNPIVLFWEGLLSGANWLLVSWRVYLQPLIRRINWIQESKTHALQNPKKLWVAFFSQFTKLNLNRGIYVSGKVLRKTTNIFWAMSGKVELQLPAHVCNSTHSYPNTKHWNINTDFPDHLISGWIRNFEVPVNGVSWFPKKSGIGSIQSPNWQGLTWYISGIVLANWVMKYATNPTFLLGETRKQLLIQLLISTVGLTRPSEFKVQPPVTFHSMIRIASQRSKKWVSI